MNQPNEPTFQHTVPAYSSNPYEDTVPEIYSLPVIPPPPPTYKKRGYLLIWSIGISLLIISIISAAVVGYYYYGNKEQRSTVKTTPTIAPTLAPTATATLAPTFTPVPTLQPTAGYYATDIYNDFVANGLGGYDPKIDTKWSCCSYAPENGAVVWTDTATGYAIDIAVFASIQEAETDEQQLYSQGFYTNVVHDCLLSYEKAVPQNVIRGYVQLMQTYCN